MIVIGPLKITASRWPGQKGYNWRGMTNSTAPLNNGARFGGGWKYSLGVSTGGWSERGGGLSFDLLFGIVRVEWTTAIGRVKDAETDEYFAKRKIDAAVKQAKDDAAANLVATRNTLYEVHKKELAERDAEQDTLKKALGNLVSAIEHRHDLPANALTFLKVSLDDAHKALKTDDEIPF